MIYEDYFLRMIEDFFRFLERIAALKLNRRWDEVTVELKAFFQQVFKCDPEDIVGLSESELFARVIQGEPTHAVRTKLFVACRLLEEAADAAVVEDQLGLARELYVKSLNLLLETLAFGETPETPEFVPKVDGLVRALDPSPLPARTQAMLMRHFEQLGEFGRAETALFGLRDLNPENEAVMELGRGFYERLRSRPDDILASGGLPRDEVEAGWKEFQIGPKGAPRSQAPSEVRRDC